MPRIQQIALVGALLAGCASGGYADIIKQAGANLTPGEVTMGVMAKVAEGRVVQSVVSAYTPADVDHLHFDLSKQNADTTWTVVSSQDTPAGSGTTKTVNFSHLKMNSTYKVAVKCYTAGNLDISKADASGVATVTTTNDNFVGVAVNVNLADKIFDGTTHPVVTVATGSVVNTSSAEAGAVAANN